MKLPFAFIIGKSLDDIAEEQLSRKSLSEAIDLAFDTHNYHVNHYNNPIKPVKFDRIYREIAHPIDHSKKVKVVGDFDDLPISLVDVDLEGTGPYSQNQLVLLYRGIYLQSVCDYIHTVDLLQGIGVSTPYTYVRNTERRIPNEGEVSGGASINDGSSWRSYPYYLGSRRVYKTIAKELLLNGAELSHEEDNLLILCENEELADLASEL